MRIFQSACEAVKEIERDLYEMGHEVRTRSYQDKIIEGKEDFKTKEIIGYSFTLMDGSDWSKCFEALGFTDIEECKTYTQIEASARVLGDHNPGISWTHRPDVWRQFLEADGKFSYTYPGRLGIHYGTGPNQIHRVREIYKRDPGSRQMILSIYAPHLDHPSVRAQTPRRIPCTMHYQILRRDDQLTLIQVMRSLDIYTHLPIDMSIAWLMAKWFEGVMNCKSSKVIMQTGSLHAYEKDMKKRRIF